MESQDQGFASAAEVAAEAEDESRRANFRDLFAYICSQFPSARADPPVPISEGGFSQEYALAAGLETETRAAPPRLAEHHVVEEIWSLVRGRWASTASAGKGAATLLPRRGSFYKTPNSVGTAPCNEEVERRLNKPIPARRPVTLSLDSCRKAEDQLAHMRDMFSFQTWIVQTLVKLAADPQVNIKTSPLFRQAINSLHLVTDTLVKSTASISVALQVARRETYVSHLPPHYGRQMRSELTASPLDSSSLFDDVACRRLFASFKEDMAVSANINLSRVVPSFSRQRGQPRFQQQQQRSPLDQGPSTSYSGQGRGFYRGRGGRGRGKKNKGKRGRGQSQGQSGGSQQKNPGQGFQR